MLANIFTLSPVSSPPKSERTRTTQGGIPRMTAVNMSLQGISTRIRATLLSDLGPAWVTFNSLLRLAICQLRIANGQFPVDPNLSPMFNTLATPELSNHRILKSPDSCSRCALSSTLQSLRLPQLRPTLSFIRSITLA